MILAGPVIGTAWLELELEWLPELRLASVGYIKDKRTPPMNDNRIGLGFQRNISKYTNRS